MMGKSKGAGDDNDGLEITAIGSVYKGSWEKKYWSCSRGKYRHPYPIGYQAIRNLAGQMYKMEIREGDKGPVFVVISEEGITCSGDTPTMAWEKIQMKKALRFQKRHRSQFSRVDGAELFGFTNPLVQRLFRELLANGNETAKESDTNIHQHEKIPASSFGKLPLVRTEGSIREKCPKLVKKKSVRASRQECPEINKDCGGLAASIQNGNAMNQSCRGLLCELETIHTLGDSKPLNSSQMLKDTNVNFNGIMNNKEGTTYGHKLPDFLDYPREVGSPHDEHEGTSETCIKSQEVNGGNQNLAVDLGKDTLQGFELETSCTNPFVVKDELQADNMPASVQVAKDLLEEIKDNVLLKGRKYNKTNHLAIVPPLEANSETPLIEPVISKECNFSPLQKVTQYTATQSSDGDIDKGESDSMGQELAKSMMLVLLPQALPLIRHTDKERKKIKLCEGEDFSSLAKHDHLNSVYELHSERKDCKTFSSEMHVVSNHQTSEDTRIDRESSSGIAVTHCGFGVESQTLCAEDSIEEGNYCDMSIRRASNVLQVSKVGCTNLREADIEHKLYKSKSCESTEKDSPAIEFVVPDSLEDEECLLESLKRNSYVGEQQASFKSHDLTIVNMEADAEALSKPSVILEEISDVHKFGCSTDNMDINLRRKNSLSCSRESDVKEDVDIIMSESVHYKLIGELSINDGYTKCLSTQVTAFNEFNSDKSRKSEIISVHSHSPMALILDQRHGEGDQFVSQSEKMEKRECNEQDLSILDCKNIHDQKSHCVDCEFKAGQFCGLRDQDNIALCVSGICNPKNISHNAYSDKQQQAMDSSNDLQVISAQVNMSVPCTQTAYNGFVHGRTFDHSSFDKKSTAEENLHLNSCGKCIDKECPCKVSSSWADCNLNVSRNLFQEKSDFGLPEETPGISIGAFHCKQTQNSDKISDTHGVFPSVSNLELYAHMTMDVGNHQGVDCFGHGITGEMFSDTPPCIVKPQTVMNSNYCEVVCPNQGVHINAQQGTYENTCDILSTELVGCYEHSIPVISMVLSVLGVDIHLCVVCGVTQERQRSLFIYKVVVGDASDNCSWLIGYAAAMLPDEEYYFDTKYTLDKYGIQITPGGENLILLESIKVQNMREGRINCLRSQCLSQGQWEGHGVKLIALKDSHVSVSAVLSSTERMYCILVSASQSIIAAGENGTVHVWNMDSSWSKCLEEFVLASPNHTSSVWELLAVPHLSHLIISHDCGGCYVMWDVSKRVMLSNFSSLDYNIFQSIALGCVTPNGQHNMGWNFTDYELLDMAKNCKDSKDNTVSMEEEESRTGNKFAFSHADFCEETAAVCLLVLAAPYKDELERNQAQHYDGLEQRGLWRFALLKNNVLLVGGIFDESASAVSMLSRSGIIGTSEGYIYIWDAKTGRKIFASRDFEGVYITCISQNQMPGAFAVAGSNNRVLLYMQVLRPSNMYILGNK